ncbi:polysaccharide deacetylase family protein [Oligoflexus tunisiensis]|uniref:polysaccharide deacetylase family protein n=1 Tax=Oligoflexus tunisiensis TaxID=708132 RepID=UPI00114D12CF|nr:polysaccharide deacetylase family protein [Oligoflexus tunisiensis]
MLRFLFAAGLALASQPVHCKTIPISQPEQKFIYCVEGMCSPLSNLFLHRLGIPLNTHHTCQHNNHYALTFDDGPSRNFKKVLDLLASEHIQATFFVVGQNLAALDQGGLQLLKQAYEAGHEIANHSYSHKDLTKQTPQDILQELGTTRDLILKILGDHEKTQFTSSIIRPPFGYTNFSVQELLEKNGYTVVRWNADRFDWRENQAVQRQIIIDRVMQQFEQIDLNLTEADNKSILDLNHDFSEATLTALPDMIKLIKARGYQFVTMTECLLGDAENERKRSGTKDH